MAAPDPPARLLGHQAVQRRRLRIVHQAHVPAAGELARVHLVVAPPRAPLILIEILRRALQRVVHQLGRVEELLAAVDHLPLAVQPHVAHQRHERVEDLRDPAAESRRGDVHHAPPLQRLRQLPDLVDQAPPADVRVVGKLLVAYGYGLEHRGHDSRCGPPHHRSLWSSVHGGESAHGGEARRAPTSAAGAPELAPLQALPGAGPGRGAGLRLLAVQLVGAAELDADPRSLRRRARVRPARANGGAGRQRAPAARIPAHAAERPGLARQRRLRPQRGSRRHAAGAADRPARRHGHPRADRADRVPPPARAALRRRRCA